MAGFKILIADDDPLMTSILSSTLSTRGYAVSIARDAMQAVMFAVQQQPDEILEAEPKSGSHTPSAS